MAKKKKKDLLFSEKDQEKHYIEFLRKQGYGVFKVDDDTEVGEAECVNKLKSLGYLVQHIDERLVKVDLSLINSVDDIVVYFYEKLRRHKKDRDNPAKRTSQDARAVDRSVLNHLINWRVEDGKVSLEEALEEVFLLIDVMFDKAYEWKLDIRSTGILSISKNKPFVLSLLREVHLMRDAKLSFEIDRQIHQENEMQYLDLLETSKKQLQKATKRNNKKTRRKIEVQE